MLQFGKRGARCYISSQLHPHHVMCLEVAGFIACSVFSPFFSFSPNRQEGLCSCRQSDAGERKRRTREGEGSIYHIILVPISFVPILPHSPEPFLIQCSPCPHHNATRQTDQVVISGIYYQGTTVLYIAIGDELIRSQQDLGSSRHRRWFTKCNLKRQNLILQLVLHLVTLSDAGCTKSPFPDKYPRVSGILHSRLPSLDFLLLIAGSVNVRRRDVTGSACACIAMPATSRTTSAAVDRCTQLANSLHKSPNSIVSV